MAFKSKIVPVFMLQMTNKYFRPEYSLHGVLLLTLTAFNDIAYQNIMSWQQHRS